MILGYGLFTGCMKDKGNYDLKTINEIEISPLSQNDIDVFVNDTLKITPTISQAKTSNGTYSYLWYAYRTDIPSSKILLSTEKELQLTIKIPLGIYRLAFVVTDINTGITSKQQSKMTVASRFSSGIVVLEEKSQGGEISHIGIDGSIYRNLYTSSNEGNYIPKPAGELVGFYYKGGAQVQKPISIFVSASDRSTIELDPETYREIGPFSRFLAAAPSAPVKLSALQCYWNSTPMFALVNGKVQYGASDAPTPLFQGALLGDYEIAPFLITTTTGNKANTPTITCSLVCYDQKNGRFLWFTGAGVSQIGTYSTDRNNPGAFDPNNVKKKCVFGGYSNEYAYYNWLMKDDAGKMYFYQIYPISTQKAATAYAEIPASAEMKDATIFASSTELPHIYYASENKIMRYDYKSNTAITVYTFSSGEQITDIKFSVTRVANAASLFRSISTTGKIYVATYNGNEGKVSEFNTGATGTLESPVKTYNGFGKITSMFYKEKR